MVIVTRSSAFGAKISKSYAFTANISKGNFDAHEWPKVPSIAHRFDTRALISLSFAFTNYAILNSDLLCL